MNASLLPSVFTMIYELYTSLIRMQIRIYTTENIACSTGFAVSSLWLLCMLVVYDVVYVIKTSWMFYIHEHALVTYTTLLKPLFNRFYSVIANLSHIVQNDGMWKTKESTNIITQSCSNYRIFTMATPGVVSIDSGTIVTFFRSTAIKTTHG